MAKLEKELACVQKRLAAEEQKATSAPADMVNLHYAAIRELRTRRDELTSEIDVTRQLTGASTAAVRQRCQEIRKRLVELRGNLASASPDVAHKAAKDLIERVTVTMAARQGKSGRRGYRGTSIQNVDICVALNSVSTAIRRIGLR